MLTGSTLYIVNSNTNTMISGLTTKQAQLANSTLANYLGDFQSTALERAEIIASNESILENMIMEDYESLIRNLRNLGEGIDFATICDANGIVLGRSHSDDVGDDLSDFGATAAVIQTGKGISKIDSVQTLGLVVSASAGIYNGDELIGSIACGFDLNNPEYLDAFKRQNGCEASIFNGSKRINTTVTDEHGERITEVPVDEKIVESVIENMTDFTDRLSLSGNMYRGYYSPIIVDNRAIGMLFTGVNIDVTLSQQNNMQYLIVIIAIITASIGGVSYGVLNRFRRVFTSTLDELSDKTASLNTLENVLDAMSIFLYVTDPETDRILFTNKALNEHMGLEEDVIGEHCYRVFQSDKECRCEYCSLGKLVESNGEPVTWEAYNSITGRYYRNIDRLVDWPDGKKVHFCQRIDITEIKQTQDMLLRTSSIVESSPNFISLRNVTGECTFVNTAASLITGYWEEELIEDDYVNLLFDEETAERVKAEVYPTVLKEGAYTYEVTAKMKDGRIGTFSVCTFLVEADQLAFGTVATDITEKKQFETDMLKALNKAEQANRAKNDFLSRMSHEMRTPMNAILGMANMALKTEDQEESRNCLKRINRSAEHLLGIINDILEMSKIESGKLTIVEDTFILEELLNRVADVMEIKLKEKKQYLSVHIDENLPETIYTDGHKLAQIMVNLLSNANKFTQDGGNICLRVHRIEEDGGKLLVEVEDNGIGIAEEQIERLFEAFEQGDNTITRQYGGTGLGLAISKSMINMMGGEIWVKSEVGKGSVFSFTIQEGTEDPAEDELEGLEIADDGDTDMFAGKNILLADDVELNRMILAAFLEDMEINVECAENGLEAFDKFASEPDRFDLIFMDIHMPEMNGYEATGKIRELGISKALEVPIVAVTADVFSQDIDKCISAGMNDHIGKPLDMDIVISKMRKYLL